MIYASDDDAAARGSWVPGELALLVAGNRGRLLDARRTPVTILGADAARGCFTVRVDGFEDAGAEWELALADVSRFELAADAARGDPAALAAARARFDVPLAVHAPAGARERSLAEIAARRAEADRALAGAEVDIGACVARRRGSDALIAAAGAFLAARGVGELDPAFTAAYVSNPRAGQQVAGHAIVLAELGVAAYHGSVPRPGCFDAPWTRAARAEHVLWRMALAQAAWARAGGGERAAFRAAASDTAIAERPPGLLEAWTLSREVADAHFAGGPTTRAATIWRAPVDPGRLLMTFLETRAMNERYLEAEVVMTSR